MNIKPRHIRVTHLKEINAVVRHGMIMNARVRHEREKAYNGNLYKYDACQGNS
jgi:hypothetical protein